MLCCCCVFWPANEKAVAVAASDVPMASVLRGRRILGDTRAAMDVSRVGSTGVWIGIEVCTKIGGCRTGGVTGSA